MSGPTALYRWRDCVGDLLYVGITTELLSRTSYHGVTDPWWPQIASCTVDWYDDPAEAHAAEIKAIVEEHPRYNLKVPRRRSTAGSSGNNRRRLELLYCDAVLRKRTGRTFAEWVGERRPHMSWRKITQELGKVTGVEDGPAPYTVQRWYASPLREHELPGESRWRALDVPADQVSEEDQ